MKVIKIVFSPTGGTEKVADIVANNISTENTNIDLCNSNMNFKNVDIDKNDMVIIAIPSYGGRAPATAIHRLKEIKGNSAKCIIICVYGNRAYEDTLVEMEDAAKECGFNVIAAISAIAEHSIMHQYATNRPDKEDEKQLANFVEAILNNKEHSKAIIPGNRTYKKSMPAMMIPKPTKDCVKCGICAKDCPVKAINNKDYKADPKICISCMRCVKECPHNARKVNNTLVSIAAMAIKKECEIRKENELFLLSDK